MNGIVPAFDKLGQARARGAYGLRLVGLSQAVDEQLVDSAPDWPLMRIERRAGRVAGPPNGETMLSSDGRVQVFTASGGQIDMIRDPLSVCFTAPERFSDEAIVHPLLSMPAAVAAFWNGRSVLHGGAFVHRGRAWGLVGEREAGKSTMLGALSRRGVEIVSDDLMVMDGITVFAGPRSIDLRAEPASLMGGESLGVVGARPRWRMRTSQAAPSMVLAGIVELEWGDETRLERSDTEHRLQTLVRHAGRPPRSADAPGLLDLLSIPGWRFVRRPGLEELDPLVDRLLAELTV